MERKEAWGLALVGLVVSGVSLYAALTKQTFVRHIGGRLRDDPYGGVAGWIGFGLGLLLFFVALWRATRD